jgi:hypothetical protein
VDGFEEDPEIKKEGQISKGEEIRLRFPIPPTLFLTGLAVCSIRSTRRTRLQLRGHVPKPNELN